MDNKRHIAISTTASLPWMTGTAVNPLFRAAYLAKDGKMNVSLVIPWLSMKDQELVYPNKITFSTPSEQKKYVFQWLEDRTGFAPGFTLRFYPGKFSLDKRSILAAGDITEIVPDEEVDIAVLEEPEHLTWYHHGKRWKTKFRLVIGVIHTNYLEYVKREKNRLQAHILKYMNSWVVSIYCHKVIRLSAATQDLPRSIVCNVHGVNPRFLEIGQKKREEQQQSGRQAFTKSAYYIGKMVWNKGYRELLNLLIDHQNELAGLEVDLYGTGEDSDQVQVAAKKLEITVNVYPGRDHADPLFHDYKVFLNPSTTDVVCTTTAEALAMGKLVVCANHPSNDFFKQFQNCRMYDDNKGFVEVTKKVLSEEPSQLTDSQRYELSWEAATARFLKASDLNQSQLSNNREPAARSEKTLERNISSNFMSTSLNVLQNVEDASAFVHYVASGFELSRRAFGAIPGSLEPDKDQCLELGLDSSNKTGLGAGSVKNTGGVIHNGSSFANK